MFFIRLKGRLKPDKPTGRPPTVGQLFFGHFLPRYASFPHGSRALPVDLVDSVTFFIPAPGQTRYAPFQPLPPIRTMVNRVFFLTPS